MGLIGLSSWPRHSESTVRLPDHKETQMRPCLLGPIDWEDASGCSHLSKSLTLHQPGLTTLVYPYTTHLSGGKCSTCVYIGVKGWHPPLTSAHWVLSTSQFRQRLTSVGIGHARLNNNLPCSPTSPSPACFFALFYFHTATLCLSQGLGLGAALTATEEEGERSNNTKHSASAYSGTKLEFEIRCKSPSGIIALVTG